MRLGRYCVHFDIARTPYFLFFQNLGILVVALEINKVVKATRMTKGNLVSALNGVADNYSTNTVPRL